MKVIREQAFKLSEYIDSFWLMEADLKDFQSAHFSNMIPEGIFELIFELDSPVSVSHKINNMENHWQSRPKSFIGGLFDHAYELHSDGKIKLFGARFKSGKMSTFLPHVLIDFKNQLIDIKDLFSQADLLENQINSAENFYEMIQICEDFLIKQLNPIHHNQLLTDSIIKRILLEKGSISINALCSEFSISELKLRRLFYNKVGINPKTFCKINRLKYFLGSLNQADSRLTETTFEMGYFDQSHFIRDVKTMMGKSPRKCSLNQFQQQFKENPLQETRDLSFSL